MEYRVYLPRLRQSAERLEQLARKQRRAYDNLQDTIARLRRLSYMDPVITALRRREREAEEQLQKTLRMAQALRRIHQMYLDMENAILDGLELPSGAYPPGSGDIGVRPAPPPFIVYPPYPRPHPHPGPYPGFWFDPLRELFRILNDMINGRRHPAPHHPPMPHHPPRPGMWDDLWGVLRRPRSPFWVSPRGRGGCVRWCCPVRTFEIRAAIDGKPAEQYAVVWNADVPTVQVPADEYLIRLSDVPAAET